MSLKCDYCGYETDSERGLKWHTSHEHKDGVGHVFKETQTGTVGDNYEQINIRTDNEKHMIAVHRLIAYAHGIMDFEGLCDSDVIVHHKSGHGLDNRPENLESMTRSEHQKLHMHSASNKMDWESVFKLREQYQTTDLTQSELANRYGISKSMVQKITQNRQWKIEDAPDRIKEKFET